MFLHEKHIFQTVFMFRTVLLLSSFTNHSILLISPPKTPNSQRGSPLLSIYNMYIYNGVGNFSDSSGLRTMTTTELYVTKQQENCPKYVFHTEIRGRLLQKIYRFM